MKYILNYSLKFGNNIFDIIDIEFQYYYTKTTKEERNTIYLIANETIPSILHYMINKHYFGESDNFFFSFHNGNKFRLEYVSKPSCVLGNMIFNNCNGYPFSMVLRPSMGLRARAILETYGLASNSLLTKHVSEKASQLHTR